MQLLLSLFWVLVFAWLIGKIQFFKNLPGLPYRLAVLFFGLKILAGSSLIYIYTYYYTDPDYADVYKYFYDGQIMYGVLFENPLDYLRMLTGIDGSAAHLDVYYEKMGHWYRPWYSELYNDSRLVIRFNALVSLFSFGYIHVHNVFINFLSFSGLVALFRFFSRYSNPAKRQWLAPGIFLFPGLLFWGSGILKEGLLLWSFGFWVYFVDGLISKRKVNLRVIFYFLWYSFILLLLKPYTLFLWLPCMIVFYLVRNSSVLKVNFVHLVVILFLSFLVAISGKIMPGYDILEFISSKQNDFIDHTQFHEAGSQIHTVYLKPTVTDISMAYLKGIADAFFRPHVFEVYSVVTFMAAVENLLLIAMLVYALICFDRKTFESYPLKWSGLWFTILLFGFIGMITVAYGGMVRYRIPALPFFWLFIIHMAQLPPIKGKIFGSNGFFYPKND
jgi:hypothetical protein